MNRNTRHGLFGFALAIAVSTTTTAMAQSPMPELFGPPPSPVDVDPFADEAFDSTADDDAPAHLGPVQFAPVESDPTSTRQADISTPDAVAEKPAPFSPQPRLVDSVPSSSDLSSTKPTAMELRQARALYRQRQRLERLERNLWAGYEPLRPHWNSIPMMSSRYPARTTVVVPVYVYPR